jgi:hypothetical protein
MARNGRPDLGERVEVRLDPKALPGDLVPALARLLRLLRDRRRAQPAQPVLPNDRPPDVRP